MSVHDHLGEFNWVDVCSYESLPINTGKTVRYTHFEVALFRMRSGRVQVMHNRCPHKDGVLAEGMVCDEFVFCPMHDRKIHIPTGVMQAPDTGCVQTYPVKVENDRIIIGFPC